MHIKRNIYIILNNIGYSILIIIIIVLIVNPEVISKKIIKGFTL